MNFIFPAGDIKFCWSPEIDDSVDKEFKLVSDVKNNLLINFDFDVDVSDVEFYEIYDLLLQYEASSHKWSHNSSGDAEIITEKALRKFYSIMDSKHDKGHDFDLINKKFHDSNKNTSFYTAFKKSMLETALDYYSNKNLNKAISYKNEILIYESKGYYSVPVDSVYKEIKRQGLDTNDYSHDLLFPFLMEQISKA